MTSVPMVDSLRRSRRLDRHQLGVGHVLDAMKRGAALHLHYQNGRALWSLSSGPFVTADIAAIVITKPSVVPVDVALFLGVPGQTWRFAEQQEDPHHD
jgi:hypothetical protein